jgi:hypothetical protein
MLLQARNYLLHKAYQIAGCGLDKPQPAIERIDGEGTTE